MYSYIETNNFDKWIIFGYHWIILGTSDRENVIIYDADEILNYISLDQTKKDAT